MRVGFWGGKKGTEGKTRHQGKERKLWDEAISLGARCDRVLASPHEVVEVRKKKRKRTLIKEGGAIKLG